MNVQRVVWVIGGKPVRIGCGLRRNGVRWAVALALVLRQGEALGLKWLDITTEWHHGCPETKPCGMQPKNCPRRHATGTLTVRRAIQRQTWQHGCGPDETYGPESVVRIAHVGTGAA